MKQNFTSRQGALEGVEVFLAVAEHRNFSRAAAQFGVSTSAVSQSVRSLEARIGVALFLRTTRSVGLTEAGERFFSRAKPAFEELVAASQAARELGQGPSGRLRLTVPPSVIPILIEPLVASFTTQYPGVEVEISANERLLDLATEGFDAGVRLGQFIAADMVAVRLTPPFRMATVGSPGYLQQAGRPAHPDDLRGHAFLRLRRSNGALAPWTFMNGDQLIEIDASGPLIANDFPTLIGAAVKGMGLVQVPEPIAMERVRLGQLEAVLSEFAPSTPGVFLYYPDRRQVLPKLRAFIDHAKAHYATMPRASLVE